MSRDQILVRDNDKGVLQTMVSTSTNKIDNLDCLVRSLLLKVRIKNSDINGWSCPLAINTGLAGCLIDTCTCCCHMY